MMMTAVQTRWQRMQNMLWLIGGLLFLFLSFLFWVFSEKGEQVQLHVPQPDAEVQIQPEKVAATTYLGGMLQEVRPLMLSTRAVATGDHGMEFRGSKFLEQHKNKYSIELFSVAEEEVINSFLRKQAQRDHLYYLRLSQPEQPERYVMIYGIYDSADEANRQLASLNLGIPSVVQPKVTALNDYQKLVNDMGSEEKHAAKTLYGVNLNPAPLPRLEEYVPRAAPAPRTVVRPKPPEPVKNKQMSEEEIQQHFN